jgi:hypothetical protein
MPAHQSLDQQEFLYRLMGGSDATAQAAAFAQALANPYGAIDTRVDLLELQNTYDKAGTGAAPVTGAQTFDLSTKRVFHRVKGDNGQTWTFTNPVAGIRFAVIIEQDNTGTRLKPTLAGYTFVASGLSGALPTLTTTANRVDVFEFVAVSATVAIQVSQVLNLS